MANRYHLHFIQADTYSWNVDRPVFFGQHRFLFPSAGIQSTACSTQLDVELSCIFLYVQRLTKLNIKTPGVHPLHQTD